MKTAVIVLSLLFFAGCQQHQPVFKIGDRVQATAQAMSGSGMVSAVGTIVDYRLESEFESYYYEVEFLNPETKQRERFRMPASCLEQIDDVGRLMP